MKLIWQVLATLWAASWALFVLFILLLVLVAWIVGSAKGNAKKWPKCPHRFTYYSDEHDNFYCSDCGQGMGERYYSDNLGRVPKYNCGCPWHAHRPDCNAMAKSQKTHECQTSK